MQLISKYGYDQMTTYCASLPRLAGFIQSCHLPPQSGDRNIRYSAFSSNEGFTVFVVCVKAEKVQSLNFLSKQGRSTQTNAQQVVVMRISGNGLHSRKSTIESLIV
jgi:hypothetical protein